MPDDMPNLAAVILTYNEEHHIIECIESVRWAGRVIVFDSFSTDRTVELARDEGAEVLQHPFENFGAQRDAALKAIDSEWILFIDADERVTEALRDEMVDVLQSPRAGALSGWWLPRHNYIFGKLTLGAGWFPDYQLRLLRREHAAYDPGRPVHEEVILQGESAKLSQPLIHYNYDNDAQFHKKQRKYIQFEAQLRFEEGQRPKFYTPFTGALRQFWWRFISLKGYRDGFHGIKLSLYMAYYEFLTWSLIAKMDT